MIETEEADAGPDGGDECPTPLRLDRPIRPSYGRVPSTEAKMSRRILVVAALVLVVLPLAAQNIQQQSNTIQMQTYTADQTANRLSYLGTSSFAAAIATAKARGVSVDDYGRELGKLFASSWGAPNTGTAVRMARSVFWNATVFAGGKGDVVNVTDTAVTFRFQRVWATYFGAQKELVGVTLDEYNRVLTVTNQELANYLGLRYSERVDGDWVVATITGRGKDGINRFPPSTYTVTLSAQQLPSRAELAGTWEWTYTPAGRYTVTHDGKLGVEGEYEISFDEITLKNEKGPLACNGAAKYRWTGFVDGRLGFGRIADDCDGRFRVLARTYAKK